MPPKPPTSDKTAKINELLPERILRFLGGNPAIGLENKEDFDALFTSLIVDLDYRDTLEIFDIRDIAEIQWEINRARSIRRAAIERALPSAATELLAGAYKKAAGVNPMDEKYDHIDEDFIEIKLTEMFRAADQGNASARRSIEGLAKSAKVTDRMLQHGAYCKALKTINHLDEAVARLEHRRDQIIRRFENRRRNLGTMTRGLLRSSEAVEVTLDSDDDPKVKGKT